jgi:hypothetical protein
VALKLQPKPKCKTNMHSNLNMNLELANDTHLNTRRLKEPTERIVCALALTEAACKNTYPHTAIAIARTGKQEGEFGVVVSEAVCVSAKWVCYMALWTLQITREIRQANQRPFW